MSAAGESSIPATPPLDNSATILQNGPDAIGGWIGPYKLLQQLGEGGMGTVYMAEQLEPVRRKVAIKLIREGLGSAQMLARFEAERQALALMDHINIATVLDAGSTPDGRPWFALELVHGVPITQFCDERQLSPRERLKVFVQVCHAIQHAHQKGIIHRDIKPSNILVTLYDGQAVPKVIDFGVAKAKEQQLTERTMYTQYGAVVGTLEYMSPEQAEMSALGVDTRSDIYSLGVVLYELLTGSTPLGWKRANETTLTDMLRMIHDVEPARPSAQLSVAPTLARIAAARHTDASRLPKLIRGELDWVVMKCLEKDRSRRYESANSLARDVERYLANEAVEACPPSTSYRLRRFVRRYHRLLIAAAVVMLLLAASAVLSGWQAWRALAAEQRARESSQQMQVERDRARRALAEQAAERLDGDLRRLATIGEVLASSIPLRNDWTEEQLATWLRSALQREPSLFAVNVAFEPNQFQPGRADYDLYLYREGNSISQKLLLPPEYQPLYREWDWYTVPKSRGRSQWSEPYVDTGGGEIPMVTYAAPFQKADAFAGVVTFDLSTDYFDVLRKWLDELRIAQQSSGFVVSGSGLIVSHPDDRFDFAARTGRGEKPARLEDVLATLADAGTVTELSRKIMQRTSGALHASETAKRTSSTLLHAPIPAADWMIVVVVPGDN